MEEFRLTFNNLHVNTLLRKSNLSYKLFIVQGILLFIMGTISLFSGNTGIGFLWLGLGLIDSIGGLYQRKNSERFHVIFNQKEVDIFISKFNHFKSTWDKISSIKLNPITLHFYNGRKEATHIDLGEFDYKNVRLVKEKLREFALLNNTEIN